jgi:hypothetical protein
MKARSTLAKSLNTVTAVSRVAAMLFQAERGKGGDQTGLTAGYYTRRALAVLGQPSDWSYSDATFAACVAAVKQACTPTK